MKRKGRVYNPSGQREKRKIEVFFSERVLLIDSLYSAIHDKIITCQIAPDESFG